MQYGVVYFKLCTLKSQCHEFNFFVTLHRFFCSYNLAKTFLKPSAHLKKVFWSCYRPSNTDSIHLVKLALSYFLRAKRLMDFMANICKHFLPCTMYKPKTIYRRPRVWRLKHFSLVWQSLCLAISMNVLRGLFGNSWGPFLWKLKG